MKDTLWIKIIKTFYGVKDLDEYRLSQINQIGNQLFMVGVIYILLSTFLSVILFRNQIDGAELILMLGNLIYLFGAGIYSANRLNKLDISTLEVSESNYEVEKRKALRKLKLTALSMLPAYYLLDILIFKKPIWAGIDSIGQLINHGFYILIIYFVCRHYKLKNLKKYDNEKG